MRTDSSFKSSNGTSTIHWVKWAPEGEPKAVFQIVHGMSEYIDRYEPFAEYLNSFGILVCGHDHAGHGKSAEPKDYGYFGEHDGWKRLADDVELLHKLVNEEYPGLPYIIMGHSMGSFVLRAYLSRYGKDLAGAVIMGTSGPNPMASAGLPLLAVLRTFKGGRGHSGMMTAAAFGSYNKRISNSRTPYDWLSRDDSIVDAYVADPGCGFEFTLAGYEDLQKMLVFINKDSWYSRVPKNVPLLLVSGGEDPVGAYGEGPKTVAKKLMESGCDAKLKLYDGMRHEILNEIGKEEPYEDIKNFVFKCIERSGAEA